VRVYIKVKCNLQYRILCRSMGVCQEINFGSQKLDFSLTRLSRADLFQYEVCYKVRQHMVFLLLPLRSKRATFYINFHGRVSCFCVKRPEWPVTFLRNGIHIQIRTVNTIQIQPPNLPSSLPRQPYLQGMRPFGRSLLHRTFIQVDGNREERTGRTIWEQTRTHFRSRKRSPLLPLIFFCSWINPNSSASAVGGHPGT
jgi:hypothetical protein